MSKITGKRFASFALIAGMFAAQAFVVSASYPVTAQDSSEKPAKSWEKRHRLEDRGLRTTNGISYREEQKEAATSAKRTMAIAHRGASYDAPENTMASFRKAVEMKADYIEMDVQETKDGELVIIHDTTVDRTTDGKGNVKDLTLSEIRKLDAGRKFDPSYSGEKVPTFDEVLDAFPGKVGLLVELKAPFLYPGIEEKLEKAIRKHNWDDMKSHRIIIQSFDAESLQRFHKRMPQIPVGILASSGKDMTDEKLQDYARYAKYVNPNFGMIDKETIERVHRNGLKTFVWTATEKKQIAPLLELKVDGIIANNLNDVVISQ